MGSCAKAAGAANLENAAHYEAVITTSSTAHDDITFFLGLRTVDSRAGAWCSIAPGTPPRPSCAVTGPIFASADDFGAGPKVALITDEHGAALSSSQFYSGFYLPPDATSVNDGVDRNCGSWGHHVEFDGGGPPPPNAQDGFGLGNAVPRPPDDAKADRWIGDSFNYCLAERLLPLLCIERP